MNRRNQGLQYRFISPVILKHLNTSDRNDLLIPFHLLMDYVKMKYLKYSIVADLQKSFIHALFAPGARETLLNCGLSSGLLDKVESSYQEPRMILNCKGGQPAKSFWEQDHHNQLWICEACESIHMRSPGLCVTQTQQFCLLEVLLGLASPSHQLVYDPI